MAVHYNAQQKLYTWLILVFCSGAAVTLISDKLPANLSWVKAGLALLTAAISLLSIVQQNQKRSMEAADLHFRWNSLAGEAQDLWNNMYDEDAVVRLNDLRKKWTKRQRAAQPSHMRRVGC